MKITKKKAAAVLLPTGAALGMGFGAEPASAEEIPCDPDTTTCHTTVTFTDLTAVEHECSIENYLVYGNNGPNTLDTSAIIPESETDPACWEAFAGVIVTYRQQDSENLVTQELRSERGWAQGDFNNVADPETPAEDDANRIDSAHTITFRNCDSGVSACTFTFALSDSKTAA